MSVPTTTVATANLQHSRAGGGTTLAAVPTSAIAVVTAQQASAAAGTQTSSGTMPTVTLTQQQGHQTVTLTQTQQPAVVKHVQEVIMSPQRATIPVQSTSGVLGQLKSIPTAGQVRQVSADTAALRQVAVSGAPAGVAGVTIHQVPAIAAPTNAGATQQVKNTQSMALQQAVQQVQAHAHAQQQTQQRQHVLQTVTGTSLPVGTVTATVGAPLPNTGTAVVAAPIAPGGATTASLQAAASQSVSGAQASPGAVDQSKTQYSLRLRNQPSKQ